LTLSSACKWGDEGKGKVVDVLTPRYEVVARFQGGPNAGQHVGIQRREIRAPLDSFGHFQGGKTNIIGNGVVIDAVLSARRPKRWLPAAMT